MYSTLFTAGIPVFALAVYIYNKDKEKEPMSLLFKLLLGGVLASLATVIITWILGAFIPVFKIDTANLAQYTNLEVLIHVFVCVALLEETCKYFFLYKYSFDHAEFDTIFDMVIYAAFVSLGFAFFEDIFYIIGYGVETGIYRAFTAIPMHACTGIFMGLYLGDAALDMRTSMSKSKKDKVFAILIPTLLHGLYDYAAFTGHTVVFILSFILIVTIAVILLNKRSKNDVLIKYRNNECPDCHAKIRGKYCINCGKKLY